MFVTALALCGAAQAFAQAPAPTPAAAPAPSPTAGADGFPPDAQPLAPEALRERLRGKVFHVALADGGWWRLEYRDKQWYVNTHRGFNDDGTWHVEGSSLCGEARRIKLSCNPMRLAGGVLLMKRDTGEIVKFEPR